MIVLLDSTLVLPLRYRSEFDAAAAKVLDVQAPALSVLDCIFGKKAWDCGDRFLGLAKANMEEEMEDLLLGCRLMFLANVAMKLGLEILN